MLPAKGMERSQNWTDQAGGVFLEALRARAGAAGGQIQDLGLLQVRQLELPELSRAGQRWPDIATRSLEHPSWGLRIFLLAQHAVQHVSSTSRS